MPHLKISLFGAPLVEVDQVSVETGRRKAIALLAYLAVTNQPYTRDTLATLLWPDYSQLNARAVLRSVLKSLKAGLGHHWLQTDRDLVALKQDDNSWVDVADFRRLIAESQTNNPKNELAWPRCGELLGNAVELYRNDFMAGFTLRDSAVFDEWQSFQTEKLRQELAAALERLVDGWTERADYPRAIQYAQHWLAMDPLHEPAHRHLMQLYAWTNQRAAALRQYEICQAALHELGVTPETVTAALDAAIRDGQLPPPPIKSTREAFRFRPSPPPPKHNLPAKRTPFLAREAELTQIATILADPACRLLTLTGLGGVGKTRLALEAAEDQVNCFTQAWCMLH